MDFFIVTVKVLNSYDRIYTIEHLAAGMAEWERFGQPQAIVWEENR